MKGRCLVTGVAGFIGSHLAEALLRDGWRVTGLDALDDNYDPRIKAWNLEALGRHDAFRWVQADLMEADLPELLDGASVVYHLAARPGVRESWGENYRIYERQNVLATQRLLEACVVRRPRRLVYASSSSVYGEMPGRPVREDDPQHPISPYGVTKLAGEHLVRAYRAVHGLSAVSLRYFTVYGPRQRPDMAFHRFFRAILTGGELTLFGDGSQTRDVTYVGDVIAATMQAGDPSRPEGVYNIGGGRRVSLNEVLELMQRLTGRAVRVRHLPRGIGDPVHTGADTDRARRDLSFQPATDLEEGLRRMRPWVESCLERGL